GITARDLGKHLRLEKSSVSRMLRKLVLSGDVREEADGGDSRIKRLRLTGQGQEQAGAIHGFANRQVSAALTQLTPADAHT
ncbi:MarR family winged helix-turn-helix transcriptional regulator, partial [Burkholderia sp. SIMBA_024]|uniref:MarR family winged helix-turn-helix transcriptional regulator n=1 Tax=Burkholderia sp. SIMBA_024 TaxID=3085768 RepID=UPI00397CC8DB